MGDSKPPRLRADDWTDAALDAVADDGLSALAIEPLAERMGTTKGSFYWHFPRRESLLDAVLARWEQEGTDDVIAAVAQAPPGAARLRRLFEVTSQSSRAVRVEQALLSEAGQPSIAAVLERVTARRIAAVTDLFAELGFPPDEARRRGVLAYASFLGYWQLQRVAPGQVLPATDAMVETVVRTLTAPA